MCKYINKHFVHLIYFNYQYSGVQKMIFLTITKRLGYKCMGRGQDIASWVSLWSGEFEIQLRIMWEIWRSNNIIESEKKGTDCLYLNFELKKPKYFTPSLLCNPHSFTISVIRKSPIKKLTSFWPVFPFRFLANETQKSREKKHSIQSGKKSHRNKSVEIHKPTLQNTKE